MSTGTVGKELYADDVSPELTLISDPPSHARVFGATRRERGRGHYEWFLPGARSLRRTLLTSLPLALADALALLIAAMAAGGLVWLMGPTGVVANVRLLLALESSLLLAFVFLGLYPGVGLNPIVELRQVVCGTTLVFGVFLAATRAQGVFGAQAEVLLWIAWPLSVAVVPFSRTTARAISARFSWWGQKVLIFGGGDAGLTVHRHLQSHPSLGLRSMGIVDDEVASVPACSEGCYCGGLESAAVLAADQGVAWAVVAMPERSRQDILRVIKRYAARFPYLLVVPDIAGLPTLWTSGHDCGGLPALRVQERLLLPLPRLTKRLMDLSLIVLSAPLLVPLMGLVAALVKLDSAGPIFYCQERIGMGGRRFYARKFRSMATNADLLLKGYLDRNPELRLEWEQTHKLRHDPRVTRIGRLLRKTSLDELPQLWNVLIGEMSLVGPRPIVEAEIGKYSDCYEHYLKVIPGITGLWQISGRSETTYGQRVELDAFYACNWSAWLDLYILAHGQGRAVARWSLLMSPPLRLPDSMMTQQPTIDALLSEELPSADDNLLAAEIVAVESSSPGAMVGSEHLAADRGESASQRMRAAFGWVVGSRVAGILITLLINIQMARWLSPEDFAGFSLMCSAIAFGSGLAGLGLSAGVVRFLPESLAVGNLRRAGDTLRWSWTLTLLGWLFFGTLTICLWSSISQLFGLPPELRFAVITALSLGILGCMQLTSESLRGLHDLRLASLLSGGQTGGLLSNVVLLGGTAFCSAHYAPSLQLAVVLNLVAIVVVLPLGWFGTWQSTRARRSRAESIHSCRAAQGGDSAGLQPRELLTACLPLMLIQCVTFFSTQADLWIAGATCTHEEVALYGAARRLMLVIVMPLQMANYLVMGSIAALYVQGQMRELQALLRRVATLFFLPSVFGLTLVVFFGAPLLSLLYGNYYGAAAWPLALLGVGQIVLATAGSAHCALLMTGHQLKALRINALAALALIVVGSWATKHHGIGGLAAVSAAVVSLESIVMVLLARRLLGVWTHVDLRLIRPGMLGSVLRRAHGREALAPVTPSAERCHE